MPIKNTPNNYGWLSILLHWVMAIAILAMFILGLWMESLDYYDPWYREGPYIHKSIGIMLLILLLIRFFWRLNNTQPQAEPNLSPLEKTASYWVHRSFYILLLLLMLSGYFISTADGRPIEVFTWFTIPAFTTGIQNQEDIAGSIHNTIAWLVIILASLHAAAALKHHFIDQDNTLRRMLGTQKKL